MLTKTAYESDELDIALLGHTKPTQKRVLAGDLSGDGNVGVVSMLFNSVERAVTDTDSWFRTIILGLGFFNSSYDAFALNIVLVILSHAHTPPLEHLGLVATATMIGVMIGQLTFGSISDIVGRKHAFLLTQAVVVCAAIGASLSSGTTSSEFMLHLVVCRVIMGIGIGGEYPLSASFAANSDMSNSNANAANRGKKMGAVFALQGAGMVAAPLAIFLLLKYVLPLYDFERAWRLPLALTALPGLCFAAFRLYLREPIIPTSQNLPHGTSDSHDNLSLLQRLELLYAHRKMLFGCALAWLVFDIVFYANAMFSGQVLTQAAKITADSSKEALYAHIYLLAKSAVWLSFLAVPGYVVGIKLIDVIGRKPLQIAGFALMAANFGIMVAFLTWLPGLMASKLGHMMFVGSYGLTFFFANLGPNLVTYVMAGEAFPYAISGTALGVCAAAGKVGAIIGALVMPRLLTTDLRVSLGFCAVCSIVGILITVFMTHETMGVAQPPVVAHVTPSQTHDEVEDPSASSKTEVSIPV